MRTIRNCKGVVMLQSSSVVGRSELASLRTVMGGAFGMALANMASAAAQAQAQAAPDGPTHLQPLAVEDTASQGYRATVRRCFA